MPKPNRVNPPGQFPVEPIGSGQELDVPAYEGPFFDLGWSGFRISHQSRRHDEIEPHDARKTMAAED